MKDDMTENELSTEPTGLRRRTLVAGTAWAIPAVAVVGAAPAFAASPVCVGGVCISVQEACKHPGEGQHDKEYHFTFKFCNNGSQTLVLAVTAMSLLPKSGAAPVFTVPAGTGAELAPGGCFTFTLHSTSSTNSANGVATLTYTINDTEFSAKVQADTLPPCQSVGISN